MKEDVFSIIVVNVNKGRYLPDSENDPYGEYVTACMRS